MVASDTVVGLVGAGILLVALVGVFVYESNVGRGSDAELEDIVYNVTTTGSSYRQEPGSGTQLGMTGRCVPPPGQTECSVARAMVDLKFQGLPNPGSLHYVIFIEGTTTAAVGEATPSGQQYVTGSKTVNGNYGNSAKIVISLEPSGSATAPTWKIATLPVNGNTVGSGEAKFITSSGNHTVSFTASGSNTNVNAQLENVQNKTGYTYRGWMVKETDAGINYTFVGNFSATDTSATEMDGTITGSIPGARLDYVRFIVTIEKNDATISIRPAGPPVIAADYNLRASPTTQK